MPANSITREQWAAIEDRLKHGLFCWVEFQLDGHTVHVQKKRVSESRFGLIVYIDGWIKGNWMLGKDEAYAPLVELVWRRRASAIYKPKEKKRLERRFGKHKAREYFPGLDKETVTYDPHFNTAASLVRQFKRIPGLTLVEPETEPENSHETRT